MAPTLEERGADQVITIKRLPAEFIIPAQRLKLQNRPPAPTGFTKSSMTVTYPVILRP
jgi:hypothetical protein